MVKYSILLMHDQSEKKMFNSSKPVKTVIFFVFEQIKKLIRIQCLRTQKATYIKQNQICL